jgi:hypothetical protein
MPDTPPVYPFASSEKVQEALTLTGLTAVPGSTVQILQAIVIALANRGGGGGDPVTNAITALGGVPIGRQEEILYKQIFVLAATT